MMGPHFLLQEIGLAGLGCAAVALLQGCVPLQEPFRRIFQGAIAVVTILTMLRVGGAI